MMQINADFDEPVLVHTKALAWQPSPMAGVERRMLDRIGGEVARATSLVSYTEGSAFSEHTHSGGEEFIVLEGVFQDELGDYPAGTYVRNPVGTRHMPRSEAGCTIFVKLWQFEPDDQEQMSLDLANLKTSSDPARPGVRSAILADRDYEQVALEDWTAGCEVTLENRNGFELLVLSGSLDHSGETYGQHDWIRWPAGKTAYFSAGGDGARVWIKRGHLRFIRVPGE